MSLKYAYLAVMEIDHIRADIQEETRDVVMSGSHGIVEWSEAPLIHGEGRVAFTHPPLHLRVPSKRGKIV